MAPPSLVAGPIHGLREWPIYTVAGGDGLWLGTTAAPVLWPKDRPAKAECTRCDASDHAPPARNCSCGLYALHPIAPAARRFLNARAGGAAGMSVGLIKAWGTIEVHEDGFRAEYARPEALILVEDPRGAGLNRVHVEQCKRLADAYDVPILEFEDVSGFEDHCRIHGLGLAERTVEDLFLSGRDIIASPKRLITNRRDGGWIEGRGYVVEGQQEDCGPYADRARVELPGVDVLRVAGCRYRADELQDPALAPGNGVKLVPAPGNQHDPDAVAVFDADERIQLGYVPRGCAAAIAARLRAGRYAAAISIWEWRDRSSGRRVGLHVLVAASPRIRLEPRGEGVERNVRRASANAVSIPD